MRPWPERAGCVLHEAQVTPVFDDRGIAVDFKIKGDFPK
jgi:hypothetical protein